MLTIKSQVEAVHRMQSEWVLSTYRVETLSDRLASVIQKHHQSKSYLDYHICKLKWVKLLSVWDLSIQMTRKPLKNSLKS